MKSHNLQWQKIVVKYLLYTNEGASDMALNCVYSMIVSGINKDDILVYTIDQETKEKFSEYDLNVTKLDASQPLGASDLHPSDDYQDWNTKGFHRVVHYMYLPMWFSNDGSICLY